MTLSMCCYYCCDTFSVQTGANPEKERAWRRKGVKNLLKKKRIYNKRRCSGFWPVLSSMNSYFSTATTTEKRPKDNNSIKIHAK